MISGILHIECIGRAGANHQLLPCEVNSLGELVIRIRWYLGHEFSSSGLCEVFDEVLFSENEVIRLLTGIQESKIPEWLVYLSPGSIVIILDWIILCAGNRVALALGIPGGNIEIHRLQTELITHLWRDLISELLQFLLCKFSGFPYLD